MKGVIHWFAGNSVAANLLMLSVVALGLLSLPKLKQEVVPTIEAEVIQIQVPYPGAAPEEVEQAICARVEENVQGITGVDQVTSSAAEGMGSVTVKLLRGSNRVTALNDVQAAIDRIDTFPDDAEEPIVNLVEINASAIKVMVWGATDGRTLRSIANDIQNGLAGQPDISKVELKNAPPFEISVEVSEDALRRHGLSFDQVAQALASTSLDLPGGSIKTEGGEILLRGKGQAYTGAEFGAIPLRRLPNGTELLVRDIATIRDGFADTDQITRFNGQPAVIVEVYRVGDQSALALGPAAKRYLEQKQTTLPAGIQLTLAGDETVILRERLDLMLKNAWQGLLLVLIMLALFLRFKLAMWVTVGIPISFLGAIWLMPYQDVSINMISLFAFIIVLGIVVDDAIVVAENIHHHRHKGQGQKDGLLAATLGASQMSKPVIFAVLTTMVAFLPMLFMPGTMGTFSRNIPLIVIGALTFSVVECLFVLPAHLKHLPAVETNERPGLLSIVQGAIDRMLTHFIKRIYTPAVRIAVDLRYATIAVGLVMFLLTLQLPSQGYLKFNFFPQIEADDVSVQLTMPQGTPLAVTQAAILRFERVAEELGAEWAEREGHPVIKSLLTSIGGQPAREKNSQAGGGLGSTFSGAHLGEVNIELVSAEVRDISSKEIARQWEERAGEVAGAESISFASDLMGGDGDVTLRFRGDDLAELREVADHAIAEIEGLGGVIAISDNFSAGKRELQLSLTPAGQAAGVSFLDLSRQVRQAFYGEEVQSVQRGRDEVKVFVRYTEDERKTLATLEAMRIRTPDGRELPFSYVASVKSSRGYSTISRADRSRTIDVTLDLDTKLVSGIEMEETIAATVLPDLLASYPQVASSFEGKGKERGDFMMKMASNGIAALLAMFVLLAIPLRSYSRPLAIMAAIPFGIIGAFWGHLFMGFDLSMFSIIGIMALTGVVVNDSLVMIDYIDTLRRDDGLSASEAVVIGAQRRFRAILLTTLTTFAGLTPLLLERSLQALFMIPMAISLAFGVLFATFITLVTVPALYMIIEDSHGLPGRMRAAWQKMFGKAKAAPSAMS